MKRISFKLGGCECACVGGNSLIANFESRENELRCNSFLKFWSLWDNDYKITFSSLIVEEVRKITLNICNYTFPNEDLYMIGNLS